MMRKLAIAFLLLVVAGCTSPQTAVERGETRKPNIIFVLTDDQRFDSLGCAGNRVIQTPNLDRLAKEGVRFQNQFVTTAICCVSRASIFMGQYQRRHGVGDFVTPLTPAQWSQTYPALLRAAGYRTGFIGKFGVGDGRYIAAKKSDFDFWRGLPGQAGQWFIDPSDPKREHATTRFGDQALEFLDGCTNTQPFCLSISFNAPHARDGKEREFQPDARDEPLYADTEIPVAQTATEGNFQRLPDFVQTSEARRRWEKRFATPEMFQRTMRDYYRLVTGIDREIGRIRARLAERGVAENTVIVFTSDNGWFAGERGLADKWFMYEESIRVPLIVFDPRLPNAKRGRTVSSIALNVDFAPTFLDMAGLTIPETMQGRSLVPFVEGRRVKDWRKSFFYEHDYGPKIIPPSEGIRTERWAYIRWLGPNPNPNSEGEELYDLLHDPLEQTNLATRGSSMPILGSLREEWERSRVILR